MWQPTTSSLNHIHHLVATHRGAHSHSVSSSQVITISQYHQTLHQFGLCAQLTLLRCDTGSHNRDWLQASSPLETSLACTSPCVIHTLSISPFLLIFCQVLTLHVAAAIESLSHITTTKLSHQCCIHHALCQPNGTAQFTDGIDPSAPTANACGSFPLPPSMHPLSAMSTPLPTCLPNTAAHLG